jgi:membrane-bound metal-dependent hydrolase YbcI (DUF457 family)
LTTGGAAPKLEFIMPVIGHAFVGLATAIQCEPKSRGDGRPLSPATIALWIPGVVAMSYVPDVVTQVGAIVGLERAGLIGHSLLVGVAAGAMIAGIAAAVSGLSLFRLMGVSIGTILGHDVLDILQATDRAPFWPWSTQTPHIGIQLLPERSFSEGVLFLLLFAAFAFWRVRSGRSLGPLAGTGPKASIATPALPSGLAWSARGVILAIVLAAVATHAVRGRRERQANLAGQLLRQGRYSEALLAADAADHWPRVGKPGRIDLIRGETHEALGESAVAERFFLRAYEEDPTNFWAVADLAEFYAACNAPAAERRRLVQPYADELRRRFSRDERLADVLARVDRKLRST